MLLLGASASSTALPQWLASAIVRKGRTRIARPRRRTRSWTNEAGPAARGPDEYGQDRQQRQEQEQRDDEHGRVQEGSLPRVDRLP